MGDPLSVVAGIAGIVSLGLTVCSGLLEYYGSWKDSSSDVSTMCGSLETLAKTLKVLDDKVRHPLLNHECVDIVTKCIISCAAGVERLKSKLDKIRNVKPGMSTYIQRAQYPFREKTIVSLHQIISNLRSNLSLAASTLQLDVSTTSLHRLDQLDRRMETLVDVSKVVNTKVLDGLSKLHLVQEQKRLRSISTEERTVINWLSPLSFFAKQNDALSRCQHGTGRWFLESPEFRSWLSTAGKVLWCPGIPGSGKTILVSTVIDYLEKGHRQAQVGIAYVYCVYNGEHQTTTSLLGVLLKQLALQNDVIIDDIKSCYSHHEQRGTRPTLYEMSKLLHSQVQNLDQVFIIIDALDECPEAGQVRRDFLREVRCLLPKIRLMVTSRHLASIESTFKQDTRLEIRAHDHDVREFIEAQVETRTELVSVLEGHDDVKSLIVTAVLEKTKGMFLLATLHMDSISREDNIRDVRENLQTLPENLDIIYDEALKRIERQDHRQLARAEQVLTLINCAYRPLKMEEIQHMLSIRPGDTFPDLEALPKCDSLLSACCGLVVVEDQSQIVRLVHYTTEEYFNRMHLFRGPESHRTVAGVLIIYLTFTTFASFSLDKKGEYTEGGSSSDSEDSWLETGSENSSVSRADWDASKGKIEGLLRENILLQYAAHNWGHHAREALDFSAKGLGETPSFHSAATHVQRGWMKPIWDLEQMIPELLKKSSNILCANQVTSWAELHRYFDLEYAPLYLTDVTDLQIAAAFGIGYFVRKYLKQGDKIDAKDSKGCTALHNAAKNGHIEIVQLLLDMGAPIEAKDQAGRTALHWAIATGRVSVVRLLLQRGSRPTNRTRWHCSSLRLAARNGHEEILELLVEYEANQSERNGFMGEALLHAADRGQEGVVRLILQSGKSWNISKEHLLKTLGRAAIRNGLSIMKMLIEAGAAVEFLSGESGITLNLAAGEGHAEATRLLLEAGADPNTGMENGQKPLHSAALRGHKDVVALLLGRGAGVNAPGEHNETAMVSVAKHVYGRKHASEIVQQLLQNEADPTAKDDFGRTALDYSVLAGHEVLVEILLKYDRPDLTRRNPMVLLTKLYHAIRKRNDEAVDQLLSQEEISCLRTIANLLLVYIPAEKGYERVVRLFLDLGAPVEARGFYGFTALHFASKNGYTAIVELLVDQIVDVNALTSRRETPLMLAASKGRKNVTEFLLDNGAATDIKASDGTTALAGAFRYRRMATAKLLLERGAEVNTTVDKWGRSVLHIAARSWDLPQSLFEMLLRKGADLEWKDIDGKTPLVTAVQGGEITTVQQLLDKGADPRAVPLSMTPSYSYDLDSFDDRMKLVVEAQNRLLDKSRAV